MSDKRSDMFIVAAPFNIRITISNQITELIIDKGIARPERIATLQLTQSAVKELRKALKKAVKELLAS